MIASRICSRPASTRLSKAAAGVVGLAALTLGTLPAEAAYVAQPRGALESATAALRNTLAPTGEPGSFVAAGEVQRAPDADAVAPTFATPIPEPETYALMLAGLGVLGWAARRRRSS